MHCAVYRHTYTFEPDVSLESCQHRPDQRSHYLRQIGGAALSLGQTLYPSRYRGILSPPSPCALMASAAYPFRTVLRTPFSMTTM